MKPDFNKWLKSQKAFSVPVCHWGPTQTKIAEKFAKDFAEQYVKYKSNKVLDEALNSGDGVYIP